MNWDFLYLTLERFGFNKDAVNCIRTIYQNKQHTATEGNLTRMLPTSLLFALYIDPLAHAICQSEELKGIQIKGQKHTISSRMAL